MINTASQDSWGMSTLGARNADRFCMWWGSRYSTAHLFIFTIHQSHFPHCLWRMSPQKMFLTKNEFRRRTSFIFLMKLTWCGIAEAHGEWKSAKPFCRCFSQQSYIVGMQDWPECLRSDLLSKSSTRCSQQTQQDVLETLRWDKKMTETFINVSYLRTAFMTH